MCVDLVEGEVINRRRKATMVLHAATVDLLRLRDVELDAYKQFETARGRKTYLVIAAHERWLVAEQRTKAGMRAFVVAGLPFTDGGKYARRKQ